MTGAERGRGRVVGMRSREVRAVTGQEGTRRPDRRLVII